MSVSLNFQLQALEHAKQDLDTFRAKLEDLLKLDVAKAKEELTGAVSHFEAEVKRLESVVPARILGHIAEGVHPHIAIQLHEKGVPTQAEQEAAAAPAN